jgi:hypothetical protein
MGPEINHADQAAGASLAFDVYPATSGSFTLYDEDTPPVEVSYTADATALRLTIAGSLPAPPVVMLNDFPSVQRVTVNHRPHDRWRAEGGGVVVELTEPGAAEVIAWR